MHVGIAASHHENVSLSSMVHYLSGPEHVCSRSNTLKTTTVGDSIPSVNPTRHGDSIPPVNPTPSTTTTKRACERTETSVRHGWILHFGLLCSPTKCSRDKTTAWNDHRRKRCSSCIRANGYAPSKRVTVTPAVSPRLFSSTLTFRALHGNHIVSTPFQTIVEEDKHKATRKSSPTCPSTP